MIGRKKEIDELHFIIAARQNLWPFMAEGVSEKHI